MSEHMFLQGSISSYLDRLASAEPAPGGGSVAALVGALAAALITMVTDLTLGKEKFAQVQEDMVELRQRAEKLRGTLARLVEEDADAYSAVAAAMKLPRDTEEQKEERRRVLQSALEQAAQVPLRVAEAAVEVARLCGPAAEKGNPNAVSDAGVAAILAEAAAQAAALNVKINLSWLEDKRLAEELWARVEASLAQTEAVREQVLAYTYNKIS